MTISNIYSENFSTMTESEKKRKFYTLTHAANTKKVIDLAGEKVDVEEYVLAQDVDRETGEARDVLCMRVNGEVYASVSPTFIDEFLDIHNFFGGVDSIRIVTGVSKSERTFVTCELA